MGDISIPLGSALHVVNAQQYSAENADAVLNAVNADRTERMRIKEV